MPSFTAEPHLQSTVSQRSLSDPHGFWSHQAAQLTWHKKPRQTLEHTRKTLPSGATHPHWRWFADGALNACENCVDRHVRAGRGADIAICWDSPVDGGRKERFSYQRVLDEVNVLAGVLREQGVKKGNVVLVYMPMIPQTLLALLAIARLGAIHAVVFGGFGGPALAQRIDGCKPVAILTASCGIEGAKGPAAYRPLVEDALARASHKPRRVLVFQREVRAWGRAFDEGKGERDWRALVEDGKRRALKTECVSVGANEGAYIIYTSGTTGLPKGVLRETAGHLVGLNLSIRHTFGVRGPGDVMFCASDIGWVVGHSYILYAPLLAGATTILLEGKPVGTPDASTFWRIASEYRVTTMFTAPTALRAIRKDDPSSSFFTRAGERGELRNLRALFLAGERSEPSIVLAYQKLLEKYCAPDAQVIDHWWSSESGSPISCIALQPAAGKDFHSDERPQPLRMRPGSAGKAAPGFDVRVVDDAGKELARGSMGNIVLGLPLGPTAFTTLWEDEERFYRGYLKRFDGKWVDTGDSGMVDEEGYIHVMSRSDDVINVAAHRFSTGAIEQAITSLPAIAEACVVGIPDELKGSLPFAFATLSSTDDSQSQSAVPDVQLFAAVQNAVREQIGPIASLGGMIQGRGMIPKTRSGKTLRRVLKELLENAVHGEFERPVSVPATVEDAGAVEVARARIREYLLERGEAHRAIEQRAKL